MEIYLALLIPIIVTGIIYYFKKHEFTWWEFFLPFAVTLVAILISKLIIDYSSVQFNEYWGSTVVSVYEEEPYNYWHHQTCTQSYPCGTDSKGNTRYCTRTYDCSHQEDVGPKWSAVTNIGEDISITEKQHDDLIKQFGTKKTVVKTRKNYDARDRCVNSSGTKFQGKSVGSVSYVYQTNWDGTDDTRKAYVSVHSYENRIKASDLTLFNIKVVDDKQADSLGLFKYPEYNSGKWRNNTNGFEYPTILGGDVSKETQEKFRRLNGKFGSSKQLRLWILVFDNKLSSIGNYQENYWVRGNKNELVICIGKNDNEIKWVHTFSWSTSNVLTAEINQKIINLYSYKDSVIKKNVPAIIPVTDKMKINKTKLKVLPVPTETLKNEVVKVKSISPVLTNETWNELYAYLNQNLNRFERRDFEEFDYLTVEPSIGAMIFIFIFSLVISIGVNIWNIKNDIK